MLAVTIIGILVTLAAAKYDSYRDRVNVAKVVTDILTISASIGEYKLDYRVFPADLATIGKNAMRDPRGTPYEYVSHEDAKGKGKFRKDKNIVPINSDYDLWSNGKDGGICERQATCTNR
jgi:general secretion pathway protein G